MSEYNHSSDELVIGNNGIYEAHNLFAIRLMAEAHDFDFDNFWTKFPYLSPPISTVMRCPLFEVTIELTKNYYHYKTNHFEIIDSSLRAAFSFVVKRCNLGKYQFEGS